MKLETQKMKAKIKTGTDILFSQGCSNDWSDIKDIMIINFMNKYSYISFKQIKNHLIINSTEGEIDIVFTGEVPTLEFQSFCKDQLILKIL